MYTGSIGTKSNQETWQQTIHIVDDDDADVNISAATISIAIQAPDSSSPVLQATVGDGITISSPQFTFTFSETEMNALDPNTYDMGIVITLAGITTQLFKGTVTIIDGITT